MTQAPTAAPGPPAQSAEWLAALARLDEALVSMLAHELRNPLTSIRSAVYLLRRRPSDDAAHGRAQDTIDRQALTLARLLDAFVELGRVARGQHPHLPEPVELCALVRRVCAELRTRDQLALHADLPAEELWIQGDPPRLAQVLENLVHQASKRSESGDVHLRLRGQGPAALLCVRDCAPNPEDAEDATTLSQETPGLALLLCCGVVALHQGSVEQRTSPAGTEVRVRFPCVTS